MIIVIGKNSQIGKELKKISLITKIKFLSKRQLNVCKRDNFKKLDENKIDIIINLSAFTQVRIENENDKNKAFEINVNGLKNLVSYCRKNNIHLIQISSDYVYKNRNKPKIVFLSTASIFSDNYEIPVHENTKPNIVD